MQVVEGIILSLLTGSGVETEVEIGSVKVKLAIMPNASLKDLKREEIENAISAACKEALANVYFNPKTETVDDEDIFSTFYL